MSPRVALLHYSAPPVIGGVEGVLATHAHLLTRAGHPTTLIAGQGGLQALPPGVDLAVIPELDSQHPVIVEMSEQLEKGRVPARFDEMTDHIARCLRPVLQPIETIFVHNVFTKHFNLPLTAALFRLLDEGAIRRCVAWCHDITWTSPHSRSKVHPGYPWDLLRTHHPKIVYVAISGQRQRDLASLLGCPPGEIRVIPNGVDPAELLGLSEAGQALIERLGLFESDLSLIMPVRVTQAKNIELALQVTAALKRGGVRPRLVVTGPPDPHHPLNMDYFRSLIALREELGVVSEMRFVYESGASPDEPLLIDVPLVGELLRASDALFMPSHREGFGMPVLEAAMLGIPVFCSDQVPAGEEIGAGDVVRFSPGEDPDRVAGMILQWTQDSPVFRLRKRVRQSLTWEGIFRHEVLPLLEGGVPCK